MGILDQRQAADAGADADANHFPVEFVQVQAGILDSINAGRKAVVNEGVETTRFFHRQIVDGFEALDLAGNLRGIARSIKTGNLADTGFASGDV